MAGMGWKAKEDAWRKRVAKREERAEVRAIRKAHREGLEGSGEPEAPKAASRKKAKAA